MAEMFTISAKITKKQKEEFDRKLKTCAMSGNEYIKSRIFDDMDDKFNSKSVSDIDRRNYAMLCKTYALVRELSIKTFKDPNIVSEQQQAAINHLISKDLMPRDYKPKNN